MQSEVNTAKKKYSKSLTLSDFLGGDLGQFRKDVYEFVGKMAWDPDGKCCHGPNQDFAQYGLVQVNPN